MDDKVKTVIEAFDQNYITFKPSERRGIVLQMLEAGIEPEGVMAKYASSGLSERFKSNLMTRRSLMKKEDLDNILEKSASMAPDKIAKLIEVMDQHLGIDEYYDGQIPDAFETVFEFTKAAEREISATQLAEVANKKETVFNHFTEKIASAFCSNPVGTYETMTRPQQVVILTLAGK